MSKLISQLPEDVRAVALQRQQKELGNWDKKTDVLYDAFYWESTPEKNEIWCDVEDGNYESFRQFHTNLKQQQANGWVSVEERLPEGRMATVLAFYQSEHFKSHYFVANYYNQTGWASELTLLPTHWQPLPPPPTKP